MPIFKMQCNACGAQFEKLTFNAHTAIPCVSCESDDTFKRPTTAAFKVDHAPRPSKALDLKVGADADRRRRVLEDRWKDRAKVKAQAGEGQVVAREGDAYVVAEKSELPAYSPQSTE